jgi:hypothetical protein
MFSIVGADLDQLLGIVLPGLCQNLVAGNRAIRLAAGCTAQMEAPMKRNAFSGKPAWPDR